MNKKSKKRAFFVYVIMCLFYAVVVFRLPEKMSMTRTSDQRIAPAKSAFLPSPDAAENTGGNNAPAGKGTAPAVPVDRDGLSKDSARPDAVVSVSNGPAATSGNGDIEPSLLISVPIVCHAMKERWVEKDSLIFTKKDAYNNVTWRKPLEILKDHDEEGIRSILGTIGKKRVVEFLKKEGVSIGSNLDQEEIILGRGYRVETQRLLSLYGKHVAGTCDDLIPFSAKQVGIAKGPEGFYLTKGGETSRESGRAHEAEWMMPNLANLPIRLAVEKLSPHTSHVKVNGSGYVTNQSPRAFERLRGEQECVIQGRSPDK